MYAPIDLPDIETLRTLCRYDAETGDLFVIRRGVERQIVRSPRNRYATFFICGRKAYAHRVAWKLHYGCDPDGIIDHIDRDKSNNRICNLRVVTVAENNLNRDPIIKLVYRNRTGPLPQGVFYDQKRGWFRARIRDRGSRKCLGYFKCPEEAGRAYLQAAAKRAADLAISLGGR